MIFLRVVFVCEKCNKEEEREFASRAQMRRFVFTRVSKCCLANLVTKTVEDIKE